MVKDIVEKGKQKKGTKKGGRCAMVAYLVTTLTLGIEKVDMRSIIEEKNGKSKEGGPWWQTCQLNYCKMKGDV